MDSETQVEQEITPELLAAARKLQEKQAKKIEAARENAGSYGEWVKPETLVLDESANKFKVECTCTRTGVSFWSYTSDLFQIGGLCPEERAKDRNAKKAAAKAQVKEAMAFLASKKGEEVQ
jgi:hypothetical protein